MTIQLSTLDICPHCSTQLAPGMLACPRCGKLVHIDRLTALAQEAKSAEERGDIPAALAAWREALALLPDGSRDHQMITAKIAHMGGNIPHVIQYESTTRPTPACLQCSTELAPAMLACPRCGKLVHSERLTALALEARNAEQRGDLPAALAAWREALALLPDGSRQREVVAAKITEMGRGVSNVIPYASPPPPGSAPKSPASKAAGALGGIALLAWKLKAVLLGILKVPTLLTMFVSAWVYAKLWGWKFAVGMVLSIYIHEMGHVIALRRLGFKASAPMFIPGLGALIRLQQQIVNPREDAEIGLAGPIYGLGAAVLCLGLWFATHHPIFVVLAAFGAMINIFNLLPIWSLDGGRGFHAMSRPQRWLAAATAGAACFLAADTMLGLVAIVCVWRAINDKGDEQGDWRTTTTYLGLIVALAAVGLYSRWVESGLRTHH